MKRILNLYLISTIFLMVVLDSCRIMEGYSSSKLPRLVYQISQNDGPPDAPSAGITPASQQPGIYITTLHGEITSVSTYNSDVLLSCSPDGTKIAFYSYRYDQEDVYIYDVKSMETKKLTDNFPQIHFDLISSNAFWSPTEF